jgi:hypothetical protein
MYQPMLFLHWKQIKVALIPFVIAAFGLPLLAVQGLGGSIDMTTAAAEAYRSVAAYRIWMPAYPLLAAGIGITLALSAWNWDHQLNHVYALSLPIARWRYAALKMGAGAILALVPATAFLVGAFTATAAVSVPAGLSAYPLALSVRFLLCILLAYAAFFALAAGTVKTTLSVVGACVGVFVLALVLDPFLQESGVRLFQNTNMVDWIFRTLTANLGPFNVFTGDWMLIDV